ncbi:hypothetical protein TNCV_4366571 [Trichonephila clavipes]|nr:hypothetical protein TNCV_4366571 [Trichonephila clavipes]
MFFSSMDLRSVYWEIEIDEADRKRRHLLPPKAYTSLKSCRLVSVMHLRPRENDGQFATPLLNGLCVFVTLDDIIVFSETSP